jgi:polar amino acid transport system substrate-binding protein
MCAADDKSNTPPVVNVTHRRARSELIASLAPHGILRAGINMSNFLLVNRTDANGQPDGVSPAMARALATELGLDLQLIPYEGPGDVADAASRDEWDIANIALEAERAEVIDFSPAYCEIQATYLTPPGSMVTSIDKVDTTGNRIAVKARSAYDLWLTRNIKKATLIRAATLDESFELFRDEGLEVLAGLRPKLFEQQTLMPGSNLFEDSFMAVQQCIGCPIGKPQAATFVRHFVQQSKESGLIAELIARYDVQGRLSVAP